ncbi:MAG TPA: ABC transporter permease subunit [Clostridia bacterium]|nr:ABC transporter permease subunit [Clostridia bacterium]
MVRETRRSNRKKSRFVRQWQLYALLFLPLVYIVVFHYAPMGGAMIAFKDYSLRQGVWKSPWVGMKYFRSFFNTPDFMLLLRNTLALSLYGLFAGFPVPILLALAIHEIYKRFFKRFVQMVVYIPYFISTVVVVGILMNMFAMRTGLINNLRESVGLQSVNFMGELGLFRSFYVWSGVWQSAGYNAIVYLAALSATDNEQVEAAVIDGANRFQRMWHVDLPSIAPTVVILFILAVGNIMSIGFEKVFLMQNPTNLDHSEIISTFVYKKGLKSYQYSYSTAVGLFNSAINLMLISATNLISRRLTSTSLW